MSRTCRCRISALRIPVPYSTMSIARSVRVRHGRQTIVDGPFTETKEMLAGFNLIEAEDLEEAVRIATEFPWTQTGCVEVRAVQDIEAVRRRVNPSEASSFPS